MLLLGHMYPRNKYLDFFDDHLPKKQGSTMARTGLPKHEPKNLRATERKRKSLFLNKIGILNCEHSFPMFMRGNYIRLVETFQLLAI